MKQAPARPPWPTYLRADLQFLVSGSDNQLTIKILQDSASGSQWLHVGRHCRSS